MNKGKMAAASLTAALMAGATPMSVGAVTTNLIDSVEITADTNIVVAADTVLKIEYVYGDSPVTVTKSGEGRLEIATSSLPNLPVVVAEGTFASARPSSIPTSGELEPSLRLDASDASKFTISKSNGTNFISKVYDADGRDSYFSPWYGKPYVAEETLNGLGLIDFGTLRDRNTSNNSPLLASGHGAMFGMNVGGKSSIPLGDFFYIWKDRDDSIDHTIPGGGEFSGPVIIGNDPSWFLRGLGGNGNGFPPYTSGMHGAITKNMYLDGLPVTCANRVPRGFHLFRNRILEGYSKSASTIGYSAGSSSGVGKMWPSGGFVLAELVIYSNRLSNASALRVEAQLQSKWLGLKLKNLTLSEDATLDVGAFKFAVDTLDIAGAAHVLGTTNLCFDTLTRTSSNIVANGTFAISGDRQPLVPDLDFVGDAVLDVIGSSRVQTASSATGRLVKLGDGELKIADPVASNITVSAGTLSVSPLYVRSAEYHLDSTRIDTIDWTEADGKKLISSWRDIEDPSRKFTYPSWRTVKFDSSQVRKPYMAESAVKDLTMVDFGTFRTAAHPDGWGGCLDASPSLSGLHDCFVAWIDDPDVKNYPLVNGAEFSGPCFFGLEYHWTRGKGGAGSSFPVHTTSCPINMWSPVDSGRVILDGDVVHGTNYRVGDGVHVLAQRTTVNDNKEGAPIQQIGSSYQADIWGGLKIGEVLMFKEYLTDRLRMRISGALCSKWRGDTNEWAYGELSVAAGATLNHPYSDLAVENLELGGSIAATRVRPSTLTLSGTAASLDGMLELSEGGQIVIGINQDGSFGTLCAQSVRVRGNGTLAFHGNILATLCGQSFRIVEASDVDAAGMSWKAPSLHGTGLRAVLSAKSDGLYLTFSSSGFVVSFR